MIKIIVHAFIDKSEAVVEVVFASKDETIIRDKMAIFQKQFPKDYLAIYDLQSFSLLLVQGNELQAVLQYGKAS